MGPECQTPRVEWWYGKKGGVANAKCSLLFRLLQPPWCKGLSFQACRSPSLRQVVQHNAILIASPGGLLIIQHYADLWAITKIVHKFFALCGVSIWQTYRTKNCSKNVLQMSTYVRFSIGQVSAPHDRFYLWERHRVLSIRSPCWPPPNIGVRGVASGSS